MAHSKRNTSRPIFTSHERSMARAAWGTSTARLSRESFLPFASCWLCLEPAIDPVACAQGDIFCRECAYRNILAQKKEIKRTEKAREHEEREAREEKARRDAEAQERAIREFEMTQAGLSIKSGSTSSRRKEPTEPPEREAEDAESGQQRGIKTGEKRKFSLDPDEVSRIADEARAKARKAIDGENASKPTLPSFWSPSVVPASNTSNVLHEVNRKVKTQPTCPSSDEDKPHYYSLHTLVTVSFTEETDPDTKTTLRICPACKKGLTNSSKAVMAKPCGHVLCKNCVDQFMKPPGADSVRCFVCDADLTERKAKGNKEKIRPGLVELRREGTGFSAGGNNQVKKDSVMFRC
ncbi:ENOS interacting protein [Trichocladium antarcticum]|uniref:ENOS interacting protein n=1 Tax=Trichocladium antarcticum TaxID=1450529 RepID=A0AAN6ZF09_9PEZI|nr:ENOS interacting protein [Trichocladium antarcticum]